jgi:HEAT repeat protein
MSGGFDRSIDAADLADFLEKGLLENLVILFRAEPGLYPLLADLLRDERIAVRIGASALVESLLEDNAGNGTRIASALLPLLESDSPTVRGDAAWLLGVAGDPGALPGLRARVDDDNADVREAVREALDLIEERVGREGE